jgi:deoxyribodipyrimidine photo-lyase
LSNQCSKDTNKAVFFVSKKQWKRHDWSDMKIDFIIKHAYKLTEELASLGIQLDIEEVDTFDDQVQYLVDHCHEHQIVEVVANSEVELNEQQRDKAISAQGVSLTLFEADVIVPKGEVLNQSGAMYKVFSPFKKAWLKYVNQHGFDYLGHAKPNSQHDQVEQVSSSAWPLADVFEQHIFPTFLAVKIDRYSQTRDIPSIKGTSGISPYLAAGLISPRYVLRQLLNLNPDMLIATDSANFSWLNEIIWREFYRHLLYHEQRLCKHECFNLKYQGVTWSNDSEKFEAWKAGKTGYPLVDAAMRQLNQTGWMHNRLRMVVASFLTKHLLIDWRWGEKYFMNKLIDGDLASNNGGWQWAASTGCDAQPYFRIFNPIRQSERFDPKGDFIRMYLPELESIPDKEIHFPHAYMNKHSLNLYWPAIVEHKTARLQALNFYK